MPDATSRATARIVARLGTPFGLVRVRSSLSQPLSMASCTTHTLLHQPISESKQCTPLV